jgi:outer membrane receptor protein involved in Fe transport
MAYKKVALFGAAAGFAMLAMQAPAAFAADASAGPATVTEVIVTAQKRQENIQNVGMSIQAATGDKLTKLGVATAADLVKIVPGFTVTPTYYGTVVFQLRGVGFQDTSLAGSPTVTVYQDEFPLPFTAVTTGASLDVQRVEVLKGPQGTLYGENATGGAINFIANKPTDTFQAGADLTYGRFNNVDLQGYVSGAVADGLDLRLALRTNQSGAWQKSYGGAGSLQPSQSTGGTNLFEGRFSILWKPTDKFKALLAFNGWQDRSYDQAGQLFGIDPLSHTNPVSSAISGYPLAPHNDQAAGWNSCVNTSPLDPINGGAGAVYSGGQPLSCTSLQRNNTYYGANLRMDYELPGDMTLSSLTSYSKYTRFQPIDASGMAIQDYQSMQYGKINTVYQELRLSGKFDGKGSWIVGANFQYDNTWDRFLQTYNASSANPTLLPRSALCSNSAFGQYYGALYNGKYGFGGGAPLVCSTQEAALPAFYAAFLGPSMDSNAQQTNTYAVYANAEYPILENLTLQGGVRFTQENKNYQGCGNDGGDGSWANVSKIIQDWEEAEYGTNALANYLNLAGGAGATSSLGNGISYGPGACATLSSIGPNFNPPAGGAQFTSHLDQNNVSWRVGVNWKAMPGTLLYFNVSQGWKGGSYPTVAAAQAVQLSPVVQEGLLAYEGGFKAQLFEKQLTINGAGFYYDYTNKQLLGAVADIVFGTLPALVNVPQSHVDGFELSGAWAPEALKGLVITPSVTYNFTQIDKSKKNSCNQLALSLAGGGTCKPGQFYGYESVNGTYVDLTGQPFVSAPQWSANVDAEYDWKVHDDITAFVGAAVSYTSDAIGFWSGPYANPYGIPSHTLVDLRAGLSKDAWRFQLWGHNVTNAWYWNSAVHVNDVLLRYTGQPVTYGFTLSYRYR